MDDIMTPLGAKQKTSTQDFDVPFDIISLPSGGMLYNEGSLKGKDSLEIHYLTAKEEDILTSPNLIRSGKMINTLIKSVLKDKSINPEKLLLGDRNTIIVWLRSTGYGEDYQVELTCKHCGERFVNEFNLSELDIRELKEIPVDGLFTFVFPISKKTVKFRFLTAEDESKIMKLVEDSQKKTKTSVDKTLSLKTRYMIRELDGDTSGSVISSFLNFIRVKDIKAFRKHINSIEPGIMMEQEVTCPNCGSTNKEVIPMTEQFFWPDS